MLAIFVASLLWSLPVTSTFQSIIDDSDPAVNYQPPSRWQANAPNVPKTGLAAPDPTLLYNSTWHDVSYDIGTPAASFSFPFHGTGLAIYCVLWHLAYADSNGSSSNPNLSLTALNFVLDGQSAGTYTSGPYQHVTTTSYSYNTSVYQNLTMLAGPHTFSVNLEPNSMVLFDYALVTHLGNGTAKPDPSTQQGKKIPLSPWIIAVIVGASLLISSSAIIFIIRRYRARKPGRFFDMLSTGPGTLATYEPVGSDSDIMHQLEPYVVGEGTQQSWKSHTTGGRTTPPDHQITPSITSWTPNPVVVIVEMQPDLDVAGVMAASAQPRVRIARDAEDAVNSPTSLPPPYPPSPRNAPGPSSPPLTPPQPAISTQVPLRSPLSSQQNRVTPTSSAVYPLIPPRDKDVMSLIPPWDQAVKGIFRA
ncbi:hypothetical protein FRB95_011468 [Tulasnella sp. JGI-2019a]|nr:hypothetical protein FRB95_011468 [Tulasnella sp. JGI-2019a]